MVYVGIALGVFNRQMMNALMREKHAFHVPTTPVEVDLKAWK